MKASTLRNPQRIAPFAFREGKTLSSANALQSQPGKDEQKRVARKTVMRIIKRVRQL